MKKLLLTLALFSAAAIPLQAGVSSSDGNKEGEALHMREIKAMKDAERGCPACRRNRNAEHPGWDRKCPHKKEVAYSEVKEGETYLIVKKYVKGENDPEDITSETIVVLASCSHPEE